MKPNAGLGQYEGQSLGWTLYKLGQHLGVAPDVGEYRPTFSRRVKQIDKWWLVIQGGANPKQQQLLLDQLATTVSPQLRATLRGTTPSPATFCAGANPTVC